MNREEGILFLRKLRRRWQIGRTVMLALPALGAGTLAASLAHSCINSVWLAGFAVGLTVWGSLVGRHKIFSMDERQIAQHLDRTFPELEESTTLMLKPAEGLTLLERLQTNRLLSRLSHMQLERAFRLPWQHNVSRLLVLSLAAVVFAWIPLYKRQLPGQASFSAPADTIERKKTPLIPEVKSLRVIITPPAYTGKPRRDQSSTNLTVEAGARVEWQIQTSSPARQVQVIFNGRRAVKPQKAAGGWKLSNVFTANAFYQIKVEDKLSDYYRIEVIEDKPPVINVVTPPSYVQIPYGKSTDVRVSVNVKDDYRLTNTQLVATVTKGTGEAVKFREEKLAFDYAFAKLGKEAALSRLLSLAKMGMAPGDELYFYVEATDNHAQSSRSDMFIISLQDTAQATLAEAMTLGINPVPEYFRSQRQIIIDTEKLLKEQSRIRQDVFRERSNGIGIDQKVLRLRYGKFLGEEFEDMIGEIAGKEELIGQGHHDGDGHNHSRDLHGLEAFVHNHGESEEATFLKPAIKTKLKACLAQMWEAELRLRTYQPKAALPYEYRALKLLKEVQQSSRMYVAKTGFELPPLKPQEKRLTGELDKIIEPVQKKEWDTKTDFPGIRRAQPLVSKLREGKRLTSEEIRALESAGNELSNEAIRQPGRYLSALGDLRRLIDAAAKGQKFVSCQTCLDTVEKAFWLVLPPVQKSPGLQQQTSATLGELYLEKL